MSERFHFRILNKNEQENKFSPEELILIEKLKNPKYLASNTELEKLFKWKEYHKAEKELGFMNPELQIKFKKERELFENWSQGKEEFASHGIKFEIWTQEYIDKFSDYLIERISTISPDKACTILETAAGNGALSYFLKEKLDKKAPGKAHIIATDSNSGDWNIKSLEHVEILDYKNALHKYNPDIVLTSWMPPGQDFTQAYRDCPSVKEYVLIGNQSYTGNYEAGWDNELKIYKYQKDGFESEYDELSPLQKYQHHINEYDVGSDPMDCSSTISYRRTDPK